MLAILTTHPIQYQVPLWQALAREATVPFEVWYLTEHGVRASVDEEFRQEFAWDIDLLSGYRHRFLDVAPRASPTSFWNCRLTERLRHRLRACGARAIWVQGWQVAAYWQAVWEARAAGVEVWLRGETNDLAPAPWWKRSAKRFLLGQLFRRVDRFLYIGTANKRFYEKYGVPLNRLYPAPYAVDNERFARQAEAIRGRRAEIRAVWGIPPDAFCALFCGKFIPKKRPMDLVAAAQRLNANGRQPSIHLLFVGSGELDHDLRDHCNVVFDANNPHLALRTPHSALAAASFAGFLNQTEISKAYIAADCLVLPSDYRETWGLVVNEAMAAGLPCIISDQCGCSVDFGGVTPNAVFHCGEVAALKDRLQEMSCYRDSRSPAMWPSQPPSFSQTIETVVSLCCCKWCG